MSRLQYLLVLAGCLVVTVPLEIVLGARVYRRPRRLIRTLIPVALVFVGWDLIGIARGYWSYSAHYITGLRLGALPIEELAFFLVIPICGLLAYEAVGTLLGRARRRPAGTLRDDQRALDA